MRFRPIQDQVLVRRENENFEKVSPGGIVIPDIYRKVSLFGTVEAVGPGKRNKKGERLPVSVRVGDKVVLSIYNGQLIQIDGVDYNVVHEFELDGVVEEE